jgi:hypothetical protein
VRQRHAIGVAELTEQFFEAVRRLSRHARQGKPRAGRVVARMRRLMRTAKHFA